MVKLNVITWKLLIITCNLEVSENFTWKNKIILKKMQSSKISVSYIRLKNWLIYISVCQKCIALMLFFSDNQYIFLNFVLMHLEIYHYFLLDIIMESFSFKEQFHTSTNKSVANQYRNIFQMIC